MEFVFLWAMFGIGAAMIAGGRGQNGCLWFGLGVLFGPFALLFAFLVPRDTAVTDARELATGTMRKCPYCAELVRLEAIKCRYCASDIPALSSNGGEN
jgi:hypothetical protein